MSIHTKHSAADCEVCAAQQESDAIGAVPTAGHTEPQAQPPERIWIDASGKDCSFWNDNGDAIGTIEYVRADLPRAAADDGSNDWCDDCHAYSHLPFCPSYRSRNDPLVDRLVDAVYRSMQQYDNGTWLLDNLKAKARVNRILESAPRATEGLIIEAWQPIESAPRNGTRILLVRGDYVWLDDWWKGDGTNSGWSSLIAWEQAGGKIPDPPTHWQPLPTPPRAWAKSRAEKGNHYE